MSFGSVLHACANEANIQRAEMLLTRVDAASFESNVICFNAVIHACAKPKEGDRAEHWIAEMLRGVRPSEKSYSTMIDRLSKAGSVDIAETWLQKMIRDEVIPDTACCNMIIWACSKIGKIGETQQASLSSASLIRECSGVLKSCRGCGNIFQRRTRSQLLAFVLACQRGQSIGSLY